MFDAYISKAKAALVDGSVIAIDHYNKFNVGAGPGGTGFSLNKAED